MNEGQTQYWCLDKNKSSNSGDCDTYCTNPQKLFQQKHLYTIELLGYKSDIVEKTLFGNIDDKGRKAIDTIAIKDGWNTKHGHKCWQDFMEFVNAQKFRTPKGLDWIRKQLSGFPKINNNIVLSYMHAIMQSYCTMWTETIWEIVSACASEVKFIVSDNPVTFYNYRIRPDTDGNKYPDEPSLEMVGTQTIYPLSLDYCLILTHRQLALERETIDPLQNRINARYYDRAIFSFEDIIYERKLTAEEVCTLNYVLKQQAKNYIASAKKEWLFPEKQIKADSWHEFYKLFLPPRDEVRGTTGIFLGHKDGSIEGFDPYGQKITDPKEIEDIKRCTITVKKHTRKGKFSEKLTDLLNKYDSPTIAEQNSLLVDGIADIFKIEDFENFRNNFSADKVKQLYLLIEDLWPAGTDVFKMLAHEEGFNLIYSGEIDCQVISWKLLNLGLYFDKVYITNPFPHPCCLRDSYNPLICPELYLTTTYDMILSMIALIPWIETGQVQILPSPFALDFSFGKKAMDNIEKREKQLDLNQDKEFIRRQYIKQFERVLFMTPEEALEHTIRNLSPNMPENLITELANDIKRRKKKNPLLWTKSLRDIGPQLFTEKACENLETTLYLAKLTSAIPYTYLKIKKDEMESTNAISTNSVEYEIKFLDCPDGHLIKILKDSGFLEEVRSVLRKLKNQPFCKELHEELKEGISGREKDWKVVRDVLKAKGKDKYATFSTKMFFNTGEFNLACVQNHIKDVYGDKSLSAVQMYLSANF